VPSWRVTKYDPRRRATDGAYLDDDWTSVDDIGDLVTVADYLRVESAYVAAVRAFLDDRGLTHLTVRDLEGPRSALAVLGPDDPAVDAPLAEGTELDLQGIDAACRLALREHLWCRLEAPGLAVHVGWDYYMYIESDAPCEAAVVRASRELFVERIEVSPYHR
jgi:hypothetical protein